MKKFAAISDSGKYRYLLLRRRSDDLPLMNFIMLNPSTADGHKDDPTIRRCMSFARREGYGGIAVTNLFAYRAADPKELMKAADAIGPENNAYILRQLNFGGITSCAAWGVGGCLLYRNKTVARMIKDAGANLSCLGVTKGGYPKHPLYLKGDTPLISFGD
ncbi:MAG: DUF1643 domain-containing protein [Undibacterium sp.]